MERYLSTKTFRLDLKAAISAAIAVGLSCVCPVHADANTTENSPDQLQAVTVTAEKVSNDLQKAPFSITAISAETLGQRNIQSVKDLDAVVPGVMVNVTPSAPLVITIRGAGNQGVQTENGRGSVSFNENGVYITNPLGMNAEFLDVAQLEILRGPQGSVLGQNTDGGALNITTERPTLGVVGGYLEASYGSYNLDRVRAAVNVPMGDTLAVRLAVQQEHHDGWATATGVPGTNGAYALSNENSINARVDLLWRPIDSWTFELWGEHYQDNSHGDALKNVFDDNPNPRQTSEDFASLNQARNDLGAFDANGDFDWATAKIIASYQYGKLNNPEDVDKLDFSQAVALYGIHDVYPINLHVGHSYTQEFDLTSKPGGKLDWIAGLFAMQQTYRNTYLEYQYSTPGLLLPTNLSDPASIYATGSLGFEAVDKQVLESEAAYAQATYHISDALRVTGGIRDTIGRQEGYDQAFFSSLVELHKSFSGVTGRVGVDYDLSADNLLYATWASGMKPGGYQFEPAVVVRAQGIPT